MEVFKLNEETKQDSSEKEAEIKEETSLTEVNQTTSKELASTTAESGALDNYAAAAKKEIEKNLVQQVNGMDFHEGSKSIAHIAVTAAALDGRDDENAKFLKEIKEEKQKEIKQSFTGERFKEEAKKYEAKQRKAEAFYTNFRPILEFDFSPLIPKNDKTILFKKKDKTDTSEEKNNQVEVKKPTYQDRSYGIPLMVLMLFLLTIPYCLITIVLAVGNGINAIFNGIARFGKPALLICGTLVGVAISILAVYCAIKGIDALFGTNILGFLPKN